MKNKRSLRKIKCLRYARITGGWKNNTVRLRYRVGNNNKPVREKKVQTEEGDQCGH